MKSLFNKQDAQEFIDRINKLTPSTPALWGKMNVAQMLTHNQKPLEIASGALKPKINKIIKLLFGKRAKKQLLSGEPFKKNLPTFSEAIIVDQKEFETEKQKLRKLIMEFQQNGVNGLTKDPHPFFGGLTPAEWDILQVKHLDHHLSQFGV
ncbi:MAG: DUF1569 domain-containing protein [Bacteroidetes bacterium]|nr:DUF1569 domain-containing protein [Bacteroidota bacterium]